MKKLSIIIAFVIVFFVGCSKNNGLSKEDLFFKVDSESIALNSDVNDLISLFGTEFDFSEAPSCVYEGTDKVYTYSDVEIYTYPSKEKNLIDEIVITSSDYPTIRGIKVGDTVSELKKAYGEDFTDDGSVVTYSTTPGDFETPSLYFIIESDKIVSIHYYSASNIIR